MEMLKASDRKGSSVSTAPYRRRPHSARNSVTNPASFERDRHEPSTPPTRMSVNEFSPPTHGKWLASPPSTSTTHKRSCVSSRRTTSPSREKAVRCCQQLDEELLESRKLQKGRHHSALDDTFTTIYNRSENEEQRRLKGGRSQPPWKL